MKQSLRSMERVTALLLAAILLGGCAKIPVQQAGNSSGKKVTAAPVIGTYDGKTITMKVRLQTDVAIDVSKTAPFSQGLTAVCAICEGKDQFVYMNEDGEILNDAIYAFAYPFQSDGRALVNTTGDSWFYIDTNGQKVADGQAPAVEELPFYEADGRIGLKDKNGNPLTDAKFSFVSGLLDEANYAVLAEGEHQNVLIDRQGKVLVTLPDDCAGARSMGDRIVCAYRGDADKRQFRLLDDAGTLLNDRYFTAIGDFEEGLAPVAADGKLGLIDRTGAIVIEPSLPVDDAGGLCSGLSEDRIVSSLDGRLLIIEVIRH